jgi:hypothetical protein
MNPVTVVSKFFWLMCIFAMAINAGILYQRSKKHTNKQPELAEGYRSIIRGSLTWGNLPWIVMGIGCTIGGVPSVFHYFRPQDGNPFVLAFFASVFLIWILGTHWIFFRNGAEMIVQHPGILNINLGGATSVKVLWVLCVLGGVTAVIMMFAEAIPTPIPAN